MPHHYVEDSSLLLVVRRAMKDVFDEAAAGRKADPTMSKGMAAIDGWLAHQRTAPRLMGATGAAEMLGVKLPHLARLREQDRMPEPMLVEGGNDVYVREEIEVLATELARERAERRARKEAAS